MKITGELWPQLKQCPITPLILIVAINIASLLVFSSVGATVGANTGTDGYKEIAENLVQGHGFIFSEGTPSTRMLGYMKREPVYPLSLSVILAFTGTLTPAILCLFQTLLCVISCCLLYHLGERIFDAKTGQLVAYIYALHPISFWYSTRFASEMIAVLAFLLCLLLIEKFFAEPTHVRAAQVGLWVGITALTRSAYVILLPLLLLFVLCFWRRRSRQLLAFASIIVFAYASIHSVWLIRNYAIAGEIVPFTTMNGVSFFVGNKILEEFDVKTQTAGSEPDDWADALYRSVQAEIAMEQPGISLPRLEAQTDKRLIAMARQLVVTEPLFAVRKVLAGIGFIWFLSDTTAKSWGMAMFQAPLLVFAMFGVCRQRHWSVNKYFLLCVAVAYVLSYALVSPLARYGMGIIPIVMLFASHGLTRFIREGADFGASA